MSSSLSITTSAVLPINAPENPVRATVPTTVTTAPKALATRGMTARRAFFYMQAAVVYFTLLLKHRTLGPVGFLQLVVQWVGCVYSCQYGAG